jgi:predicted Zn-dependent protease
MNRTLVCLVFLVAMSQLGGCSTNAATGRSQFILLSADEVSQMGAAAAPELIEQYGGEAKSPELRAYINEVGQRLAAQVEGEYADVQWTFYLLESDVINAFALPGGKVFMCMGLLREFDNEAQVAGVLGHEIGHVTGRHVDERISQATATQVGLGILGTATSSELAVVGANLFAQGYLLKFGRDQESESDILGVRYMVRAGYDPKGMRQVLDVLREASEGSSPPEFLSTHPHPETRLETVNRLLQGEYAYTQNSADYSLHKQSFQTRAAPYLKE